MVTPLKKKAIVNRCLELGVLFISEHLSLLERFGFGADVSGVSGYKRNEAFLSQSPSLINILVSVDVKQNNSLVRAQELCESRVEVAVLKPHIALYHKQSLGAV